MAKLTESELQERWRDRWDSFLRHVEDAETPEEARNALRDKVIIGNAERKIAGGHEGREILELLQNARDAIWSDDSEHGRVHVGVYDEGILVANTGSRFDLFDTQVEDAVTMIGETGKGGDDDTQSIGHKGVGLKSILATGDAFDIFTRPDETTDDILGVRLTRAHLVSALLGRLGHDNTQSDLRGDIADAELGRMLANDTRDDAIALTDELSEAISKLPLFNFPVPLVTEQPATDPIRKRVRELLTESSSESSDESFRTAVFIRYEDTAWRSRLSDVGIPTPDEEERPIEDRAERIWQYLSARSGDGGLQPETLVQLGGIEQLDLERSKGAEASTVSEERWEITRTPTPNTTIPELAHDELRVRIHSPNTTTETVRGFDQFRFAGSGQHHTALLVNKAVDDQPTPIKSYPLYLFYPIEGTDAANLPFCLHGRFRVETNRKALSSNNTETNRGVLREGIDLIGTVGREVAAGTGDADSPEYSDHLPWVLLPPVPETDDQSDPSADKLIDWFRRELFRELSETECIPTREGAKIPGETLLHWDETVVQGYTAYRTILDELDRDSKRVAAPPLPERHMLRALLRMPSSWADRTRALLQPNDQRSASRDTLSGWVKHLDETLSMNDGDAPTVTVPASAGRELLEGTVTLLTASVDDDNSLSDILETLAERFDGVYLLPCRIRDPDPDNRVALVTLERRRTPSGGRSTERRVRSVIWDVESTTRDVDRPPTPPKSSNMTVYFLDEQVQELSDVHHVLSTAGRIWGLRAYEGMPSFVRSLLDTFADGRHDIIEPIDFAFLAAIVDRLGTRSSDLQTGEGDFFPLEDLRTAVVQQEGDQRGNLRRRVQLRACDLHLYEDASRPISATVLGDGWQMIRAKGQSSDEESQITEEWQPIASDRYPSPVWPEPDTTTWERFRQKIRREVTDLDFVRTLSLLGTATLPGVRVLWMYGDEHPPMRQRHHWNPIEWSSEDFVGTIPDSVDDLQSMLANVPGYSTLITSLDYHPRNTAEHSQKCGVKTNGELEQVNLASWIWVDDFERLNDYGPALRELLRRHGDALGATVLRTGWSCNYGHKRRAWSDSVPSLLNWQLRKLDIWEPILGVDDELTVEWSAQASRLRYAVRVESRRGAQAARMFPYVGEDSGFSDELLATLGVKPVDELGITGATERLQKLQSVLVDGTLPEDGMTQLWIPGERINDWNQAYTQLLRPILKQLPDDRGNEGDHMDWGVLTHLPLRDGDQWVTASIDWIRDNADDIRYYQDQSPKPWETQAVEENGYNILPRTARGEFTRLTGTLGIEQLRASKLVFDLETDDLTLVSDQYSDEVADFQRALAERRDILVASTERRDDDEIVATADELSTATANIVVAEAFPDDALRQLSDPTSALYETDDGREALLLNADEMDGTLSLDGLAMGLALLVERPTKVATFREALRTDIEVVDLETRWAKRTFPIEPVKRVLGSNALRSIEWDVEALNDLLEQFDEPALDVGLLMAALEDVSPELITDVRNWLAVGEQPNAVADEEVADIDIGPVATIVDGLWTALPDEVAFVPAGLFGETTTHWVRELEAWDLRPEMETIVIEWLDEHRAALERPPFDNGSRQAYSRFRTLSEVWEQTDGSELTEIETWVNRLQELQSDTPVAWGASLSQEHAAVLECPPFVVHVCINARVKKLVEGFCSEIEPALSHVGFDWRALVNTYIDDGSLPEPETDRGAKDHQQQAFADLTTALEIENTDDIEFFGGVVSNGGESSLAEPTLSVSTGGGSGGGSTQYRGRGQQAEAYVMAGILDRVATWLEKHPGSGLFEFRRGFRRLHSEQQEADHTWHVENVWSSELLPLLKNQQEFDLLSLTNWRSEVVNGTAFAKLPLVRLINVAMERGPGFDVIDPRGPRSTDEGQNDLGLWFTPIEVKAVNGTTPPFRFRLTINEYRQAKAFIRSNNTPYVIRLVSVPNPGTRNWPNATTVVTEKIIKTESELEDVVSSQGFEEVVKGGYMNIQIG